MFKSLLAKIYAHPYRFNFTVGSLIILLLILFSGDIEQRDKEGRTALFLAAEQGQIAEVKQLLKRGAIVDARDNCQWTPFMRAAQKGHLDVVKVLLAAGGDINSVDKDGSNALMAVIINNQVKVMDYLLEQKIEINNTDKTMGWTALIWAIKQGRDDVVDKLLASGADITMKDHAGKTAYDWAVEQNKSLLIQKLDKDI